MSLDVSADLIQQAECLDSPVYRDFTSIYSQILNQTPELKDC